MNIEEYINTLSNSDLIKLTSIVVAIILALFGLIARAIAIKWKHKLNLKIKALETQSNQNQSIISSFTTTSDVSQTKRIEVIESFWNLTLELLKTIPSSGLLAYSILTKEELENFFNIKSDLSKTLENEISNGKNEEHFWNICKECEKLRPFLGENIWMNFYLLQGFAGRSRYLFQRAVENRKLEFWMDDNFFKTVFLKQLNDKELSLINSNRYFSYKYAIEIMEQRILLAIDNILSGKKHTYDSVKLARKLTQIKNQ